MPRYLSVLCLVFFLLCYSYSSGQPFTRMQKLETTINAAATPHQKLVATIAFCDEWESYSPDTLKKYTSLAKQLSLSEKDPRAALLADYYYAVYLFQVNKLDDAFTGINNVIARYKKSYSYDEMYVKLLGLRSNILLRTSRMNELMANGFELINLAEQHKDTLGMARGMLGIGNVDLKLKKYEEALIWYHKALSLMENDLFKRKLSFIYNNIAIIFYHLSNQDSTLYYIKQGIKYSRDDQNLTNLANALFLYGGMMAEFNHPQEAEQSFKEAIEVRKKIGDIYFLINDMSQLGLFYADTKNTEKGIMLCKEGLLLAGKNGSSYGNINSLYEVLGKNYFIAGDYKNYSETLSKELDLKDSIYAKNSAEAMAEMQAKYDVQKRENVIMQQNFDLAKKNYLIVCSLLLLLVVIIASYFIFHEYKRKQTERTQAIMKEEKLKSKQAVAEAEEAERRRIAADLHDNLGAYAASIASNIDHLNIEATDNGNQKVLQQLKSNSQSIVSQLSDSIWAMKKDALSLTAISDRIKIVIQRMQNNYPEITFDIGENIKTDLLLSPAQAFDLLRIMQEAINNALRHSKGSHINIFIESADHQWKIVIEDNGKGISKQKINTEGGNGLINMQARAQDEGWLIFWQQNIHDGTSVIISSTTN